MVIFFLFEVVVFFFFGFFFFKYKLNDWLANDLRQMFAFLNGLLISSGMVCLVCLPVYEMLKTSWIEGISVRNRIRKILHNDGDTG